MCGQNCGTVKAKEMVTSHWTSGSPRWGNSRSKDTYYLIFIIHTNILNSSNNLLYKFKNTYFGKLIVHSPIDHEFRGYTATAISKAEIYSSLLILRSHLMYNFFKTKKTPTSKGRTPISRPSWFVILKLLNIFTYFFLFTHLFICFLFKICLGCLPDLLSKLNVCVYLWF